MGVNGSGTGGAWRLAGSITVERESGRVVLCLAGEVDGAVVAEFERTLTGPLPAVDVVDAGAATFLSSAGVRLLIRLQQEASARHAPVELRAASPQVERVLQLTQVAEVFRRPPPA